MASVLKKTEASLLSGLFIVSFLVGLVLANLLFSLNHLTGISLLEEYKPEIPTRIYDDKNRLISEYFLQKRILLSFKDLPDDLIRAIVVKEDREFYTHKGINPQGIARAFLVNLFAGRIRQGGSTLTQQLAKVLFTSQKRSYLRKLKEVWLALQIEKLYTKNEILEMYFNQIYFGQGAYGVESAARFYLGKSCSDLDFTECALLAILPNAPNYYSPIRNPEVAQKQHWRLVRQLVRLGYADPEEAERDFQAFWIGYLRTAQSRESVAWNVRVDNAPHFTEYIRQRMFQKYGEKKLYGEGLRIYTTLDLTMQRYADDAVKSALSDVSARYTARKRSLASAFTGRVADVVDLASLLFGVRGMEVGAAKSINQVRTVFEDDLRDGIQMLGPLFNMNGLEDLMFAMRSKGRENSAGAEKVEGALVAIEPSTGKIRAMVGGGEFNSANQLNRAVQMRRQAGSSFKPFIYAAAIDSGRFTAGSSMEDSPIVYFDKEGREWIPNNYGGEYLGFVTLRKALEKSINIVSIKIADTIGLRSVIETSSRLLHLISDAERVRRIRRDLSLALGTMEVSPLEMATGFAIFANQGRDVVPYSIKQVKDRNDHLLEDEESALQALPRRQILTPQVAFIISDMLRSVLEPGGTAYDAIKNTGFKYEAYGKTGTTDNWKDAWFIGFTPELATAVWVGFDDYSLSLGVHNTGGQIAAPIWSSFMYRALTEYPQVTKITRPDGVVSVRICARSGMLPTSACREVIDENFITGSEPGDSCELCAADSTRYETRDISTEMLKKRKSNYKFLK